MKKEDLWRAVLVVAEGDLSKNEREFLDKSRFLGVRGDAASLSVSGIPQAVDTGKLSGKLAKAFSLVRGKPTECRLRKPRRKSGGSLPYPPVTNEKQTFRTFVVGPSNRLAHAAVLACSEMSHNAYNPVMLVGDEGLGKTHLLNALCLRLSQNSRVHFLNARDFIRAVSSASRDKGLEDLREEFKRVQTLIFDDLHLLESKDSSREEFFRLLDFMLATNRLVVCASEKGTDELESFEHRLLSRLNWGIKFPLERPNYETRLAITNMVFGQYKLNCGDDIADFISSRFLSAKEISDAVHRLALITNASRTELALEQVKPLLGENEESTAEPAVDLIQAIVAQEYGITRSELNSKTRRREVAWPRQIAIYLARELTDRTLMELGGLFGGRDQFDRHSFIRQG
ncbi:MAG: DnaA/Hda family protein [Planctomycetota bacterium]|nr:DnaA/Hda family protein [Planctomycetota bacterium]